MTTPVDPPPPAGEEHWDERYRTVGPTDMSWYQDRPVTSLELLDALGVEAAHSVIDIGGGTSMLVDHLVERGHRDVTVLDISQVALDRSRERLGDPAGASWVVADLRRWSPPRRWDVLHDRAVFHFLTDVEDRRSYVDSLRHAVAPGGAVVIGTFAPDGPTHCSGLPVQRYSADALLDQLREVDLVETRHEVHRTPSAADQPFTWVAVRLR